MKILTTHLEHHQAPNADHPRTSKSVAGLAGDLAAGAPSGPMKPTTTSNGAHIDGFLAQGTEDKSCVCFRMN